MIVQQRPWTIVFSVAALCVLAVGAAVWARSRALSPELLYARLPVKDALVVYIDFDALRKAGTLQLLSGSKVEMDAEYRSFVQNTQFDYTQDLDAVIASFSNEGKFLLVKGRFDWKRLNAYVQSQGGRCNNAFCNMDGSTPDRLISFFPMRPNLMALAVSRDDAAAYRMSKAGGDGPTLPEAPLWLTAPGSILKSGNSLPGGSGLFTGPMERAESVTLSFAPENSRIVAKLDVRCSDSAGAQAIAAQLTKTTTLLREGVAGEGRQPSAGDLSGVLAAGSFWAEGNRALGRWPLDPAFLEAIFR